MQLIEKTYILVILVTKHRVREDMFVQSSLIMNYFLSWNYLRTITYGCVILWKVDSLNIASQKILVFFVANLFVVSDTVHPTPKGVEPKELRQKDLSNWNYFWHIITCEKLPLLQQKLKASAQYKYICFPRDYTCAEEKSYKLKSAYSDDLTKIIGTHSGENLQRNNLLVTGFRATVQTTLMW